jgi:alpha-L-fucosidase 2
MAMFRSAILLSLSVLFLAGCTSNSRTIPEFSSFDRAAMHPVSFNKPATDFFEGALLGNGGMGAVVTTRPDGIVIYFGHNNVWDIRIAENNKEKIGTFSYVFNKVKAIPDTLALLTEDPWYKQYSSMTAENYSKPWPRPFPCGSLLLGFDLRNAELLGHRLDISDGLCEVYLLASGKKLRLQIFTDMKEDKLWMRLLDENDKPAAGIFDRIRVIPDPSHADIPVYHGEELPDNGQLSFRQVLPYLEPDKYDAEKGHPGDKAFRLTAQVNSQLTKTTRINWDGNPETMRFLEESIINRDGFVACVSLEEGLSSKVSAGLSKTQMPSYDDFDKAFDRSVGVWKEYWEKSGVILQDKLLESIWYRNLYFFNCAVKDGVNTPGLFANWSYNNIGTAWHGDYHMNYNTQQPFWMTFSTNHLEKNLAYVNLVEFLLPLSKKWAKEYYALPGAYFPHSAYPVDMTMNSYPVPSWGWEICETPWAVQGLWWHYLYSGDKDYLENRAWEPIKSAVEFLVAYMKRPEARGERWKDKNYHIFPTIPPELYALRPGFKYNYDCTVDLTLVKFIFKAFQEASKVLGRENSEARLLADIKEILGNYPEYPTANSDKYGKILVSVPGEHSQVVYNVPNALITVFPGEDHGLHSDSSTLKLVKNTFLNQQNEGGNDLVFKNLQAARIGMLDLDKFRRQIVYSLLPNGTASDKVMQVHGRYDDSGDYGFMDKMGVWFENFALPVVINECLMQSYDGTIRLFPNWSPDRNVVFHDLRAAGAFLVSAELKGGKVKMVTITSEAGSKLRIDIPWKNGAVIERETGRVRLDGNVYETGTSKGEKIVLIPK